MFALRRTLCPSYIRCAIKNRKNFLTTVAASQDQGDWNKNTKTNLLTKIALAASGFVLYKVYNLQNADNSYKNNFVADVVEQVASGVVYIEIKDSKRTDFFTGKPLTISNGSGFIVKEDGLILTNAHVLAGKPSTIVEIHLLDGRTFRGTVENIDVKSDLATVRIPAKGLSAIKLGNSSTARPGEFVIALGSPLALSNTVTFGVISSTHRGADELGLIGKNMAYIQTDAAITFGNSGGPLVNLNGEAIGINSMKVTPGISFAIPSDYAKAFLKTSQQMQSKGMTRRRYMGITMLTLTPDIMSELKMRNMQIPQNITSGVLVWKVIIGSPAYNAGLQPGDIVTEIDGEPLKDATDVYSMLAQTIKKGVTMTVYRSGKIFSVYVVPESLD